MIKVNNINGAPESTPETFAGVHSDNDFFYFFETKEEHEEFLSALNVWSEQSFIAQLSTAFDAKFETKWKAKGYTDMSDLLSHAANQYSPYNLEALSLLNWWHTEWQEATQGINEQSNIEEILNNLEPYNG